MARLEELRKVTSEIEELRFEVLRERDAIAAVSQVAESEMRQEWQSVVDTWKQERGKTDLEHDVQALIAMPRSRRRPKPVRPWR